MKTPGARAYFTPLRLLSFAAGLAVLALLLAQVDLPGLARQLAAVRADLFVLGGLIYLLKSSTRALRFLSLNMQGGLNAPSGRPRFLAMLRLTLASSLASQLLPLKLGELAYVYLSKKDFHASLARGVSSLLIVRVLDMLAIGLLFLLAALTMTLPAALSTYFSLIAGLVGLLLLGLLGLLGGVRFFPRIAARLLDAPLFARHPLLRKLQKALQSAVRDIESYRQAPLAAWVILPLVEWSLNFAMFHTLLWAMGLAPSPLESITAVTFAAYASVLPINSFGSFGTQEAGWAAGLVLLGWPQDPALNSAFATHLLSLAYMLVLGGLAWGSYLVSGKERER